MRLYVLLILAGMLGEAMGAKLRIGSTSGIRIQSGQQAGVQGYANPYCTACRVVFNRMNEDKEATAEDICAYVPDNKRQQCEVVHKAMKGNRDVLTLLENGCLDLTKKLSFNELNATYHAMGAFDPRVHQANGCPGLVACNIIESAGGGPMCGQRLRQWGDFLREDALDRPIRPSGLDTFPNENTPPLSTPVPWYRQFFGDPYCDMCIDIVVAIGREKESMAETICHLAPYSMQRLCEGQVRAMRKNPDLRKVILEGCVDATSLAPIEKGPGRCSGEVGCNIIEMPSRGGPFCGNRLREWGDFVAGGDSEDLEVRNAFEGGAPLMSGSPFFPSNMYGR